MNPVTATFTQDWQAPRCTTLPAAVNRRSPVPPCATLRHRGSADAGRASHLGRLEQPPIDVLKIDPAFIGKLQGGPTETAIVEAIADLDHGLGMEVVAEGIETGEQLDQVRTLGCDVGQGYYFSRPVYAEEAEALLARRLMLVSGEPPRVD